MEGQCVGVCRTGLTAFPSFAYAALVLALVVLAAGLSARAAWACSAPGPGFCSGLDHYPVKCLHGQQALVVVAAGLPALAI